MQSIFDKETDRRGTGSMKWDVTPEELPMWVADMDFETAPAGKRFAKEPLTVYLATPSSKTTGTRLIRTGGKSATISRFRETG